MGVDQSKLIAGARATPSISLGILFAGNQRLGGGQRCRIVVGDLVAAVAAAVDGGGGCGGGCDRFGGTALIGGGGDCVDRGLNYIDGSFLKHTQITGRQQNRGTNMDGKGGASEKSVY